MDAALNSLRKSTGLFQVRTAILTLLVAIVSYYAVRLVDVLGIPPDHIATYWPATPFLVGVLLVSSRRIWPVLIVSGLGAMALADLRYGVPTRFEMWFSPGNLTEVLVATFGTVYIFKGVPELSSLKALAKYTLIAAIVTPFVSALVGATGSLRSGYWLQWRLWLFSGALGFLTVTPAILSWVQEGRRWAQKSQNFVELAALMTSLIGCGYLTFMGTGRWQSPAMLYSLVPILLWAALRLGLKGVSTSMVVVAFLSMWGAVHDRGPFTGRGPLNNALSIQTFLLFAVISFTVLAVLVEEQKRAQEALAKEAYQLAEAQRLAQVGSWWWEPRSDTVTWSHELYRIARRDPRSRAPSYKEHSLLYTPESWERLQRAVERALETGDAYELDLEMLLPDNTTRWLVAHGEAVRDLEGRVINLRGTVRDITERKRSEEALRRSEGYLSQAERLAHIGSWAWDVRTRETFWSQEMFRILGYDPENTRPSLSNFLARVHPEDRLRAEERVEEEASGLDVVSDYRIVVPDGTIKYVQAIAEPIKNRSGEVVEVVGTTVDVTKRKQAEEALSTVSQKLIEAQEQERSRIARELHDDINQRLALVSVTLDRLKRDLPSSEVELGRRIGDANHMIADLTTDVQNLSHQLHSPKLELLGLASAAASFCRELSDQHGVKIEFRAENVPKELTPEISLPVFRVLQEALQNSIKHSGSRSIQVSLRGGPSDVELTVQDSGVGFEFEDAIKGRGLGLTSMTERLKVAQGRLSIDSDPQHGTTLHARVPLSPKTKSAGAAT